MPQAPANVRTLTPTGAVKALPPRRATHIRDGLCCIAAAAISAGLAVALGYAWLAVAVASALGLAGAGFLVLGGLSHRRRELQDAVLQATAPLLGLRGPNRYAVQLTRWTREWPGVPRRITLRYLPGAPDADPQWVAAIHDTVSRRLLARYRTGRHDQRSCRLVLELNPVSRTPDSPMRVRVDRTVAELIGPTAKVQELTLNPDTGAPTQFTLSHQAGTKLAAAGYRIRIERTVSTVLPGRWRARWDLEQDTATFQLRPSFPESIWLPPPTIDTTEDVLATYDQVELPFGIDEDGNIQVWRPAIDPNLMVVGSPGTGKTVFEHTILVGATAYGWPAWIVDGKSVEFLGYRTWPNVQVVATRVPEQVAVIERGWEVMEHRYHLIVTGQASETDFEPLMLFLDEFADFRANLMEWYAGIKVKTDPRIPPVLAKTASLARKGRTSRVHLLFATQRPDAEYFGGDMRDNFRARISTGRLSREGAMMMWQDQVTGTTIPRNCRGRATTINDLNRAIEIQCYRVPDPRKAERANALDDLQRLADLRPSSGLHERLLIVPPENEEIGYSAFARADWVTAAARPDLDPVAVTAAPGLDPRALASPAALLGIPQTRSFDRASDAGEEPVSPRLRLVQPPYVAPAYLDREPDDRDVDDQAGETEEFVDDAYGASIDLPAGDVLIGDYVLIDPDLGHWAVVDEEPAPDLMDPDCTALCWRDDDDEQGIVAIPQGERVTVRRPSREG